MNRTMQLGVLIRGTVRNGWRRLLTGRPGGPVFAIAAAVGVVAVTGSLYGLSQYLMSNLGLVLGEAGLAALLGMSFLGVVLFMLITGVQLAFSSLFFADDLALLFASPLPASFVLGLKLGIVAAGSLGVFLLVAGPVTLAYLGAVHAGFAAYVVALAYGISLALTAAGMAVSFNLALARLIPPRFMKRLYAVVGVLLFVVMYMGSQFLPDLLAPQGKTVLPTGITGLLGQGFFNYSYLAWPIVQASRGQAWWCPLLVVAGGAIVVALSSAALARQGLYYGWTGFSESQRRARPRRGGAVGSGRAETWFGPSQAAIIGKDWKYLRRDVQEWVQLLMPVVVLVVLTLRMIWGTRLQGAAGLDAVFVVVMVLVGVMAGGNLGLYSLGREGHSIGIIRAAPVRGRSVLVAKFWAGYLPSMLSLAVFGAAVLAFMHKSFSVIAAALASIALVSAGSTGIAIAIGAMFPRFDAKALKQRVTTAGSLVYLAAEFVYGALIAVVAATSILPDFLSASLWQNDAGGFLLAVLRVSAAVPEGWRHLFGGLALAVICVLAAILPLGLAAARFENLEV